VFRVLASSSGGNCSVLVTNDDGLRRVCLIDLGLGPRKTAWLLAESGIGMREISDVVLTHLDTDHARPSWATTHRDLDATMHIHTSHMGHAERMGLLWRRTEPFGADPFELGGMSVAPMMMSHDQLGVASFRFDIGPRTSLGFATDLGRPSADLVDHLRGVSVLAVESNYCPQMQIESDRPDFLKNRIMSGAGHLSNHECARLVEQIDPSEHVVFLHLSRECNDPVLVADMHHGADYGFTISSHNQPTRWIGIAPNGRSSAFPHRPSATLFENA